MANNSREETYCFQHMGLDQLHMHIEKMTSNHDFHHIKNCEIDHRAKYNS